MAEMRPTHRQIEAFRALMLSKSMTEAARMLSVTQPAVSKIITQLEQELEISLFERRQGKFSPTDDAFALYTEVERSYSGLESITRAARRIKAGLRGSLRVAVQPTMASSFIAKVAKRLYDGSQELELSVSVYNSDEIVDLVASGLCDLGFPQSHINTSRVQTGPVMSVPCFCLLPPGHRLESAELVSVADLEGEDSIATADGTASRLKSDSLFASLNVTRNVRIDSHWALSIAEFVRAGLGSGIVDAFTASWFAENGGIVKRLKEDLDFTFLSVTSPSSRNSAVQAQFQKAFEQELGFLRSIRSS
ncbi:LysR substrate-binding domain-containing protein [Notoacmeibacter sp. MSK16QG-6]|uniref:LysR substrate-binding domain-containing protein n=1 Tax=Notoacmeibacter sp. MSK16QG-6 TaxID=2957982 RepID=UPI0020A150BD|nr:LysR substrate-binding domain-containing protein [Notoacmeibacter sp. MSK16QG-6]MCP1201010.1 LysR substrate-binding domain-containing protein [Notoacmeibacter sp. MSK16QG-6]